jgi:hypothetical protein
MTSEYKAFMNLVEEKETLMAHLAGMDSAVKLVSSKIDGIIELAHDLGIIDYDQMNDMMADNEKYLDKLLEGKK